MPIPFPLVLYPLSRRSVSLKAQCEAEFSVVCIFLATHRVAPKEKRSIFILVKKTGLSILVTRRRELNAMATLPSSADS